MRKHEITGDWEDDDRDDRVHVTVDRPSSSRWDQDDGADAWGIDIEEEDYAVPRSNPLPDDDLGTLGSDGQLPKEYDPNKKKEKGWCGRAMCVAEGSVDRDVTRAKWAFVALCCMAAFALAFVDIYDAVEQGEQHLGVGGHHRPHPEGGEGGGGHGGGEEGEGDAASSAQNPSLEVGGTAGAGEITMPTEPPEPPSDLRFICSFTSVSLSESSYDKCEQACLAAECCFLESTHFMSCDRGEPGAEWCKEYKSNCMVLDKDWKGEGEEGNT